MQKRHHTEVDTFIIPIVLAGVVITSAFLQNIGEVLIYNPFHRPEPHCEEFPHSDYNELYREKGTAAVTGTNTVLTFGKNNSILYSY